MEAVYEIPELPQAERRDTRQYRDAGEQVDGKERSLLPTRASRIDIS